MNLKAFQSSLRHSFLKFVEEKKEIARKYRVNNLSVVFNLQHSHLLVNSVSLPNHSHRVCYKTSIQQEIKSITTKFLSKSLKDK